MAKANNWFVVNAAGELLFGPFETRERARNWARRLNLVRAKDNKARVEFRPPMSARKLKRMNKALSALFADSAVPYEGT